MSGRRTINDVINPGYNPTNAPSLGSTNFQNEQATFILGGNQGAQSVDQRSAAELRAENEKLRLAIATWKDRKPVIQEEIVNENGIPDEFNKRIEFNDEKIKDLNNQISEQEEVMKAYQAKFAEFEDNLNKLMRLDKDIHTKLVNPEHSATLEKNVKNVMVALNSGASYGDVIKMIDSIKI